MISILLYNKFSTTTLKKKGSYDVLADLSDKSLSVNDSIKVDEKGSSKFKSNELGVDKTLLSNFSVKKKVSDKDAGLVKTKLIVPNYEIKRIDRLSGIFDQGELHVVVDENHNEEGLKKIMSKFEKRSIMNFLT